jgi:hypothetical protein
MQYFLLVPFILKFYCWKRTLCYVFLWTSVFLNVIFVYIYSSSKELDIIFLDSNPESWTLFVAPWSRYGAHFIGIVFGLLYFEYKEAEERNNGGLTGTFGHKYFKAMKSIGMSFVPFFLSSAIIGYLILCFNYSITANYTGEKWSTQKSGLFNALSDNVFAIALGFLMTSSFTCCSSFTNWLFGGSALQALSKLTFSAYLLHAGITDYYFFTLEQSYYLRFFTMIYVFTGSVFLIYMLAIPLSLMIEMPLIALDRLVFFRPDLNLTDTLEAEKEKVMAAFDKLQEEESMELITLNSNPSRSDNIQNERSDSVLSVDPSEKVSIN